MKSASSLNRDPELKDATANQLSKLLASKSNSANNTLRTINQMFDEASKQCHFDRERDLIQWLQVCVTTAAQFGLDPSAAQAQISEKPVSENKRGAKQSKPVKQPVVDDEDEEWDDEEYGYDRIGASDDDYCPTDDDDAVVPAKQRPSRKSSPKTNGTASSPPKSPRKKKTSEDDDDDQVVPGKKKASEATFPLIKEGAGAKALEKYIIDLPSVKSLSSTDILPNGYFARAFFFPSKDSFQVSK